MAIHCFNPGFEGPESRVYLGPQSDIPHHGKGSVEDAMRTEAGRNKLKAQEKVRERESELLPDSVKHLNELIEKATPSQAAVLLDNLDAAITQLNAIEDLKDMLDEEGYKIALAQFDKSYSDFVINPAEIRELAKVRLEAGKRIDLMEAHKVTDIEKLKAFALLFVRDSEGKQLDWDQHLKAGQNFTIDFRDPKTGLVNPFAQAKLTLGMVLQAVNRKEMFVSNRINGRPDTMAYLWPDGLTYNKPAGYTGKKSYVEILQGYKLATPAAKPAAPVVPVEEAPALVAEKSSTEGYQPTYNPGFVSTWGETPNSDSGKPGELSYAPEGSIYVGTGAGPNANLTLTAEVTAATPEISLDSLKGQSVEFPEVFDRENLWEDDSYEQIAKIKYFKNGQVVYDAIRMMAAVHREVAGPIDNRTMWETLRGGVLSKGGRRGIAFNEMAKAVYGKNENKIDDTLPYIKEFKAAAKTLLDNLNTMEETGTGPRSYQALREETEYTGEQADMARVTDQVFERNSYGPPIALKPFQAIVYAMSAKERPTINEDSWMTPTAGSKLAYPYKRYGETEVISHSRAFDKLMETKNVEAYVKKLNLYMAMGSAHINAQTDKLNFPQESKVEAPAVTVEQVKDPTFKLTEDQIAAARHGAMIFAAAELGVYQKVEAERKTGDDPLVDILMQMAAKEGLTDTQTENLSRAAQQKLYGVVGAYAATHDIENMDQWASWSAGLSAGVQGDLGNGFKLEFLASSNTIDPVIRTSAGGVYTLNFGKEKRWHMDLYARVQSGLAGPVAVAGFQIGYEFGLDRVWSADAGVSVSSDLTASASVGAERNIGRVLQKQIDEFREKHPEEIAALEKEAYDAIDALDVLPVQKAQLKKAYNDYLDQQIAFGVTKDFTIWYKQVKFVGAGLVGAVGLKEGGLAVGPYITIGIGFQSVTLYVPPLETPEQVSYSMQTGLPIEVKNYKVPGPDWVKVEVTDQVLWSGEDSTREAAVEEAEAARSKALETMTEGVASDAILTPSGLFTNLEIKDLNGSVQLFVDSRADIETFRDGPKDIGLNLDSEDDLLIRILEIPAAHGGNPIVIVGLTNDPAASMDEIVANSGNYLTWNQTSSGKDNSTLVDNPTSTAEDGILAGRDVMQAKIEAGEIKLGDLGQGGAEQNVRSVRYEDIRRRDEVEVASERFSEAEKALAEEVAKELIAAGFGYKKLILSDQKDKIHAKILELYAAKAVTAEEDKVKLAHQYAMEMDRPQYKNIPLEWNKRAFGEVAGDFSTLATAYWEAHEAEMKEGGMRDAFPEGSEFMVTINEKGEVIMLGGYYNNDLYGDVLAPVKWDAVNPEATLNSMEVPVTEENKAAVIGIADAIAKLDWEEKPLEGNANFNTARKTMVGDKLLTTKCSNDLYGPEDGAKLREMADNDDPTLYPELAKEFAEDVAELLAKKQVTVRGNPVAIDWEIYSGLDDNCFNLTFARNVKLVYETPAKKEVKAASTREKVEAGMAPEMTVKYTRFRVAPGLMPVTVTPEVPSSEGESDQTQGEEGDRPGAHIGEHVPELGGEGQDDAGHF